MARCNICNYCDTVDHSDGLVTIRYDRKTKQEVCSECEGHVLDALLEFGDEEEIELIKVEDEDRVSEVP